MILHRLRVVPCADRMLVVQLIHRPLHPHWQRRDLAFAPVRPELVDVGLRWGVRDVARSLCHGHVRVELRGRRPRVVRLELGYPDRKSPFWAVKRPARPYKSTIQNRFPMENAKGAWPGRARTDGAGLPDGAVPSRGRVCH